MWTAASPVAAWRGRRLTSGLRGALAHLAAVREPRKVRARFARALRLSAGSLPNDRRTHELVTNCFKQPFERVRGPWHLSPSADGRSGRPGGEADRGPAQPGRATP